MVQPSRMRDAVAGFEALLLSAAFQPVARALGFYGDLVVRDVAATMARQGAGGLTDALTRALAGNQTRSGDTH